MSDSKADADAVSEGEYLPDNHGLKRTLNLPQSTAIVTGGIIGVSIFLVRGCRYSGTSHSGAVYLANRRGFVGLCSIILC